MILPEFEYITPPNLKDACNLSMDLGADAKLMAGGTDVVVAMKEKNIAPKYIIDIKDIEGLDYIDYDPAEGWKIGALTKLRTIEKSEAIKKDLTALSDAAHYVASTQVRAKATMVGNLANASPSADTVPVLIAMDAKLKIQGADHEQVCSIADFYTGFKKTLLEPGDIITEISIPALKKNQGAAYLKHAVRKAMDLAIVGVAAFVEVENGICKDAKIVLGAVDITAVRATKAEAMLIGNKLDEGLISKAAIQASEECKPIDDVRGSAEYRKDMIRVFTKRAVGQAVDSIK